ncbi:MAG: TGS domain-containing protein, partial [Acidobacteria bacterium]
MEINVRFGEQVKSISLPATVLDAIKAFDRDIAKKAIAAKVNGEYFDLNRELPS